MREILFRGKSIESGEWVYGTGFTDFLNIYPEKRGCVWLWCDYKYNDGLGKGWIEINADTVSQFTGLIDKNGNKIFEHDVVKVPVKRLSRSNWWQKTNQNHGFVGDFVHKAVKFKVSNDASGFEFCDLPITRKQIEEIAKPRGEERGNQAVDDINYKASETEIIGNIFDNPELAAKHDRYEQNNEPFRRYRRLL